MVELVTMCYVLPESLKLERCYFVKMEKRLVFGICSFHDARSQSQMNNQFLLRLISREIYFELESTPQALQCQSLFSFPATIFIPMLIVIPIPIIITMSVPMTSPNTILISMPSTIPIPFLIPILHPYDYTY